MKKDAELHAADDKKKRELAEARNQADSMCFQMEKLMKEHTDKLKDSDKQPLEAAIAKAREAAKGDNVDAIKKGDSRRNGSVANPDRIVRMQVAADADKKS